MEKEEFISLSEAELLSGMTRQHLALLARRGRLRATKIGRDWLTTRAAVEDYLGDRFSRSKDPLKRRR